MNIDSVFVLNRFVFPLRRQLGSVVEVSGRDRLADGVGVVRVGTLLDFHSVAKSFQLFSDVSGLVEIPDL